MVSTKVGWTTSGSGSGSDNIGWSNVNLTQVIQRQLDIAVEDASPPTHANEVITPEAMTLDPEQDGGDNVKEIEMPRLTRRNVNVQESAQVAKSSGIAESHSREKEIPFVEEIGSLIDIGDVQQMVPVMIKTNLEEFQQGVILAGRSLSWFEFVQMFTEEPDHYNLSGVDGQTLSLDAKIGEYVDTFTETGKCYLVSVEKRVQTAQNSSKLATTNVDLKKGVKRKSSRRRSPQRKRKRQKEVVVEKSLNFHQHRTVSPDVADPAAIRQSSSSTSDKNSKGDNLNRSNENQSSLDTPGQDSGPAKKARLVQPTSKEVQENFKGFSRRDMPNLTKSPSKMETSDDASTISKVNPNLTPKKEKATYFVRPEADIELAKQKVKQDQSPTCPTNITLPNIKPQLMNFMTNKISNRDMLRIREELMKLKEEEDYFKLTALTPLTAGLLEQMLCRNFPTADAGPVSTPNTPSTKSKP